MIASSGNIRIRRLSGLECKFICSLPPTININNERRSAIGRGALNSSVVGDVMKKAIGRGAREVEVLGRGGSTIKEKDRDREKSIVGKILKENDMIWKRRVGGLGRA